MINTLSKEVASAMETARAVTPALPELKPVSDAAEKLVAGLHPEPIKKSTSSPVAKPVNEPESKPFNIMSRARNTGPKAGELRKSALLKLPGASQVFSKSPAMKPPIIDKGIGKVMNATIGIFKGAEEIKSLTSLALTAKAAKIKGNLMEPAIATIKSSLKPNGSQGVPISGKGQAALSYEIAKKAGVVDRSVKEIADLQHGYRFQRNPYAEANDSMRSRNNINYEGPMASFKAAALKGGLAEKAGKTKKDFDPKSLAQGAKVEKEHTSNKALEQEIAMDHLTEDPHYYEKLKKMEKKSEAKRFNDWWKEHPLTVGAGMIGAQVPVTYMNIQNLRDENKYFRGLSMAALGLQGIALPAIIYRSIKNRMELEKPKKMEKKSTFMDRFRAADPKEAKELQHQLKIHAQPELGDSWPNRGLYYHWTSLEHRPKIHDVKKGREFLNEVAESYRSKKASFEKQAFIRHEGGKYVVYSHSGKHMGTYASEGEAKHRLQQIEYFKKQGARKVTLPSMSEGPGPELQKQPLNINPIEKGAYLKMRDVLLK